MKLVIKIGLLLVALTSISPAYAGGIKVQLDGDCKDGDFSIANNDIEFFDLNLDIFAGKEVKRQKCKINVWFPARKGWFLSINKVQVAAASIIDWEGGAALLALQHRSRDSWSEKDNDISRELGETPLVVSAKAVDRGSCGKAFSFETLIETAAKKATLIQDSAVSVFDLNYKYKRCGKWSKV